MIIFSVQLATHRDVMRRFPFAAVQGANAAVLVGAVVLGIVGILVAVLG
jgi:hypothetical protein